MSQVKAALDLLDLAHTEYKRCKSLLQKSLDATNKNERSVTNKMTSLSDASREVNACFTSWASKSGLTDEQLSSPEEKYNSGWLEVIWTDVDDFQDQVHQYIQTLHPSSPTPDEQQLTVLKGQFESLKLDVSSRLDVLLSKTAPTTQSLNPTSVKMYEGLLNDAQKLLSVDLQTMANDMRSLGLPDLAAHSEALEQFKRAHQSKVITVQMQLADQLSSPPSPAAFQPTKGIEMQKSKAPTFSGKTIDYPEFKRGWQKVAGVHWDDGNQVEQIKFQVNLETRRIITRCNTMKEVWEVLDAEFAQEQEVVNAVDFELKNLLLIDCSVPEYIVKLRNYLPNLEEALKAVNGFEHLSSPARVEYLSSKFDEITLKDWDYFKSKNAGSTYERFFAFLKDRYDACRSSIARSKASALTATPQSGGTCDVNHTNTSTSDECRRCQKWSARGKAYTCPACGRGTAVNEKIHHCLEHCGVYMSMSVKDRSDCIERANFCPVHMVGSHTYADCNMVNDSNYICGIDGCRKHHHHSLHGGTTPFIASVLSTQGINNSNTDTNVLLSMQTLSTNEGTVNCLFDNCATCSLITEPTAKLLNLLGEPIKLSIFTVTGSKIIDSVLYNVPLMDNNNVTHNVKMWQVENISDSPEQVDISGVKHLFSPQVQQQWSSIASRPSGAMDILLGADCMGLHPVDLERRGNMRVLSSSLDPGLILIGSHSSIRSRGIKLNEEVSSIMYCAHAAVNRLSVQPVYEYFESDNMGIEPPRRCGSCRNCKDCSFRGHMLSQKEQYETQVIESKIHYDSTSKQFVVSYPFTQDPAILPNNKVQVVKIAEREEKRLARSGLLDLFNQVFNKMLQHGAIIELTDNELNVWDGPKHYVSLQHVVNDASETTPLRIVTNSSLSDRKGVSLNSILMKGHDALSDQWDVLTRWRSYQTALCSDVTKAYYSIRTGELEKHIRRICWRYGDTTKKWRIFGFQTLSFGDRPAASFLEIAIRRIAHMNQAIDPLAAVRIRDDRYVDDLATGGTPAEVARFMGNEDDDLLCDGTIPLILSKGSLHLKVLVSSAESNPQKIAKLGGKVLGINWNPTIDELSISFKVALLAKDKSTLTITAENFLTFDKNLLTPRNLLGIINRIYDPLGLVAPITIRLRIAFRHLFNSYPSIEWDTPLPPGPDRYRWLDLIHLLVHSKPITFKRCIKPFNAVGGCQLICYFDGSDDAFAAVIYIRWELADGSVYVTLLCAKPRVAPLKRRSTPRSELNGALVAARLTLSAVRSLSSAGVPLERIWLIGDSECTLSSLEKVNAPFGEYFGNRIGEIQDFQAQIERYCTVGENGEWWFTQSGHNSADQATRPDSAPDDVDADSVWQSGRPYLKDHRSAWPIDRNFADRKDECIPQNELLKQFRCMIQLTEASPPTGVEQLIDPYSTNDWNKLLGFTQVMLSWFHKALVPHSNAALILQHSKKLWFHSAMPATIAAVKAGRLRELDIQEIDGLQVVQGRAASGMQKFFGQNSLPVIMGSTRIAYLIMLDAHCMDHTGRDITLAMSRHTAWIVNAKKLSKNIVRNCIRCRFLRKLIETQKMASIPDILQVPAPPFSNIGIDLLGPLVVKSMVNKRASMKVWVVLFLCLNTKAISMELAPGYSTVHFLLAYVAHISQRGAPSFVHSDRGSQLVAAQKDLADDSLKYDWDVISAATASQGTTWKFAPAGGQWRNGSAEAFVKKFKRSFSHLYQNTRLNYSELNCAIKRIANVLNDRPVSAQRTRSFSADEDFLAPLTPNMLITGRNQSTPPRDYVDVDDPHLRKSFLEELEATWWYQYKVQCFDSLTPTRKWIDAKRNLCVGDIVLIQYSSKAAPGTYRLGRIKDVEVDQDGLVRTCNVRYSLCKPGATSDVMRKEVRVPIQRLVLILPIEEQ